MPKDGSAAVEAQTDFLNGRHTGDDKVYRNQQYKTDGDKPQNQKDAMHDIFYNFFIFHHVFPLHTEGAAATGRPSFFSGSFILQELHRHRR